MNFQQKACVTNRGVVYERHGHLPGRGSLMKDAIMGNVISNIFGWPILGIKNQDKLFPAGEIVNSWSTSLISVK